ncbi:hypothetical protein FO519_000863 [Halicephalobus sp. NKZ332]|nr:hypothetical protein FO519_000863 [Halicephalobus sp. NKZ332]
MLERVHRLDAALTRYVFFPEAVNSTFVRILFLLVEWTAHGIPWLLMSGFGTLYSLNKNQPLNNQWKWAVLLFGILIDLAAVGLIKITFRRARPPYNADDQIYEAPIADKFSFPSGHSSRAAMLMILGLYLLGSQYRYQLMIFPLFLGFTRIAMGRHYLFDVLAGLILGIFEGSLALQLPTQVPTMILEYFPFITHLPVPNIPILNAN